MSCCGEKRQQLRGGSPLVGTRRQPRINGRMVFEYTGPTSAVVKGPVTGRGYAFVGYGARAAIDPRDAPALLRMPYLQRVLRPPSGF
jgi:hypothetical protein